MLWGMAYPCVHLVMYVADTDKVLCEVSCMKKWLSCILIRMTLLSFVAHAFVDAAVILVGSRDTVNIPGHKRSLNILCLGGLSMSVFSFSKVPFIHKTKIEWMYTTKSSPLIKCVVRCVSFYSFLFICLFCGWSWAQNPVVLLPQIPEWWSYI